MGLWQIDMDSESSDEDELDVPPPSNDPAIQWIMAKLNSMERNAKKLKLHVKGLQSDMKVVKADLKDLKEEGDPLQRVIKGIYVWYFHDKSSKLN